MTDTVSVSRPTAITDASCHVKASNMSSNITIMVRSFLLAALCVFVHMNIMWCVEIRTVSTKCLSCANCHISGVLQLGAGHFTCHHGLYCSYICYHSYLICFSVA